jgi:hypothetical protein
MSYSIVRGMVVNNKSLSIAFWATIILSGLILTSATRFGTAQASTGYSSTPKPTVPEFTLKLVEHPYDVSPTYSTDPYTGESVMTQSGYHVQNKSIEITIKNQHFTPYEDSNGNDITLMYNIRWKGHFGDLWSYYAGKTNKIENTRDYFRASDSDYSVVVGGLSWNEDSVGYHFPIGSLSEGSQDSHVDFQVEALIGHSNRVYVGNMIPFGAIYYYNFTGEASDWSTTQTITISESQTPTPSATPVTTPTPEQTPTPSQELQQIDNLTPLIGVAIVATVLGVALGLLIHLIKRK